MDKSEISTACYPEKRSVQIADKNENKRPHISKHKNPLQEYKCRFSKKLSTR
jgi:hypothetical protein